MATVYNVKTNYGPSNSASGVFSTSGGVNYNAIFSQKIDERFKLKSLVARATNQDYKFDGYNAVMVPSIDTVPLTDYEPTGANRYGAPVELGNALQTLTLKRRRSFSFTIDRRSNLATGGAMAAGAALQREVDEVFVPEYDQYVLQTLYNRANEYNPTSNVGQNVVTPSAAVTKDNAYAELLKIQNALGNAKVPLDKRVAFVTYEYLSFLKSGDFVLASERGQEIHSTGSVGKVDGMDLIPVPSDYMPKVMSGGSSVSANVLAIAIASNLVIAPQPLHKLNTHVDPPGLDGWLIEGDFLYDCFVLNNKLAAIYVLKQYTT